MKKGHVAADEIRNFVEALLNAGGFTKNEAGDIADSLILSELMGYGSHGLLRVKEYLGDIEKGATVSNAEFKIIHETSNSLLADAQRGVGQTVMPKVLAKIREKLATQAVVTASVRNSRHIGRIGEWVEKLAYLGYAALLLVNDNGSFFVVAPPGGKQAVTSTNPVAFALPLPDRKIFMADMSTSATAFGKVKLARLNGAKVPADYIQDSDGNPTTDPEALFAKPPGSILPMGGAQGYKGFALSMFIDLLVAGLSGGEAPPGPKDAPYANSFTLTAWNPEFFAGTAHMRAQAQKYIDFIRASPPIDPSTPVRLPGDRLSATKAEYAREGIPLKDGLIHELLMLAKTLDVTLPRDLQV